MRSIETSYRWGFLSTIAAQVATVAERRKLPILEAVKAGEKRRLPNWTPEAAKAGERERLLSWTPVEVKAAAERTSLPSWT